MPSSGFLQAERGLLANFMHLNEAKCKAQSREWTETIAGEKDLGVLVDE